LRNTALEKREYSAGEYQRDGRGAIGDITARGKLPIVTGGTGLYLTTLIDGIAPVPDAVFYLSVEPEELVQRNLSKNATLDYWESGMDIGLSRDVFDSFLKYQTLMQETFRKLQKTYDFDIVDANRSTDSITKELRKKIGALLEDK